MIDAPVTVENKFSMISHQIVKCYDKNKTFEMKQKKKNNEETGKCNFDFKMNLE